MHKSSLNFRFTVDKNVNLIAVLLDISFPVLGDERYTLKFTVNFKVPLFRLML